MSWQDNLPASAKAYIGERQLDEVECIISDFPGVARGKAVPASKFAKQKHFYLPNSIFLQTLTGEWAEAAGEEGWVEPDMTLYPDLDTATAAPWTTDATLQVIHDAYDRDGAPIATAPRNVLKRVVQLFRDKGLEPVVAPEMEFFLVARNTDPAQPIVPMMGRSGRPAAAHQAYSLSAVDEYGPVIDDIYDFANAQGFEIDGFLADIFWYSRPSSKLNYTLNFNTRSEIDYENLVPATVFQPSAEISLRPSYRLRIDSSLNNVWYTTKEFDTKTAQSIYNRISWQLTKEWGIRIIEQSSFLSTIDAPLHNGSLMFTWLKSPGTAAYFGTTYKFENNQFQEQIFFAKYTHLFWL